MLMCCSFIDDLANVSFEIFEFFSFFEVKCGDWMMLALSVTEIALTSAVGEFLAGSGSCVNAYCNL